MITGNCWHCGQNLPRSGAQRARVAGAERDLCCQGCVAAAQWIEQLGLSDYYRLRTSPAMRPDDRRRDEAKAWRRPELMRHVVRALDGSRCEATIYVEGIRCTACVWLIDRALSTLPGLISLQINPTSRRARIVWDADHIELGDIVARLEKTGYGGLPIGTVDDARRRETHDAIKRLAVSAFGAMQAMTFAGVLYFGGGADAATRDWFRWLGLLVATPVVFYAARPFFEGAWRSLRARHLGVDVPVAAAIALIYAASMFEALRGGAEVYFDSVSMFVFLLLAGRFIEMQARRRAGDLVDALARATPPFAERVRGDGSSERVGIMELRVGDRVRVAEGGLIPADGVLETAHCQVDENLLTGESVAHLRQQGDTLLAGSVLLDTPAVMRVEKIGNETMLASIASLVAHAHAERPALARAGEVAAGHFVVRVLALATMTAAAWLFVDPSRAFAATVAVLVVSCPCAFALAVPAAITRAIAVLARGNVLVVHADAVESLATATHAVFDKTGTLTDPYCVARGIETFRDLEPATAWELAESLAVHSRHPVARALACDQQATLTAEQIEVLPGQGIRGIVGGRALRLGNAAFASVDGDPARDCDLVLADDHGVLARFRVAERLRPGVRGAIDALRAEGVEVEIASGDGAAKVAHIAWQLDVSTWRARQTPAGKLERLRELRALGARVMVVGDGINDAPVLAGADVAVAVAGGADLARVSSDIVLQGGSLKRLPWARSVCRTALRVLAQNQRWALGYNLLLVPLAALGFVPPWAAAIGMSVSSLVVLLNALRIDGDPAHDIDGDAAHDESDLKSSLRPFGAT